MGVCAWTLALACAEGASTGASVQGVSAGSPVGPVAGAAAGAETCDAALEVFPVACGTVVCHEGSENQLDLLAPGVEQRLLDVAAAGIYCQPSGLELIDRQQPQNSLLLLKLSPTPPCGAPMPLGAGPEGLTVEQLDCVRAYVYGLASR